MRRDLLAYSFDAAGPFHLITFEKCLFTTYNLCKPLLFLTSRRRLKCTSTPQHWPFYHGNSVYCLLSYVVDAILPLLRPISFLEAWHFGCQPRDLWRPFVCSLLGGDISSTLYPMYAIGRLFTKSGAWTSVMLFGGKRSCPILEERVRFGVQRIFFLFFFPFSFALFFAI